MYLQPSLHSGNKIMNPGEDNTGDNHPKGELHTYVATPALHFRFVKLYYTEPCIVIRQAWTLNIIICNCYFQLYATSWWWYSHRIMWRQASACIWRLHTWCKYTPDWPANVSAWNGYVVYAVWLAMMRKKCKLSMKGPLSALKLLPHKGEGICTRQ